MILRKIIKFVATKCQILRLKCTKFNFGWAPFQTPLGSLHRSLTRTLAGFKGPTSNGGEGKGWGKDGEWKDRGKEKKRDGNGTEWEKGKRRRGQRGTEEKERDCNTEERRGRRERRGGGEDHTASISKPL